MNNAISPKKASALTTQVDAKSATKASKPAAPPPTKKEPVSAKKKKKKKKRVR